MRIVHKTSTKTPLIFRAPVRAGHMTRGRSSSQVESENRQPSVERGVGRPTSHAAAMLPDLILDVAQRLFLTQGFERTSLNQLAAEARVTKRTLYIKFGDKADIFKASVQRMLDRLRSEWDDPGTLVDPDARLIHFGMSALAVALDPSVLEFCRVVIAEAPRFPALASLMEEQVTQGNHKRLTDLLREEFAEGRLHGNDPAVSAELLMMMFVGPGKFDSLFGMTKWNHERRTKWVEAAVDLFINGSIPTDTTRPRSARQVAPSAPKKRRLAVEVR